MTIKSKTPKGLKPATQYVPGHLSNKKVAGKTMVVRKMPSGKKEWKVATKMEKSCARTLKNKIRKYTEESRKTPKGKGHHIVYARQAVPAAIKYTQKKYPSCQLVNTTRRSRRTGKMLKRN
jgi:hypothetical protein